MYDESGNLIYICPEYAKKRKDEIQENLIERLEVLEDTVFFVKKAFKEKDIIEHMWVEVSWIDFKTKTITGRLGNIPKELKNIKCCAAVIVKFDEIEDIYV